MELITKIRLLPSVPFRAFALLLVIAAFQSAYARDILIAASPPQQQQQIIALTGTVTDASGSPIPGVNIQVKGTTRGAVTNPDGIFSLQVSPKDILMVSFIGYQPQEITVNGKTDIRITLKEETQNIEDVTIVAFGKQKKESVVSSIATVKVEDLKVPSSNLTTALAGRIAGIISYQRSGEPGQDNAQFFVRGVTTFGYKTDPLILIDGVELTTADLARLQPDDIASFSIMKDATSTALYGARGANGVIYVTTKEGREGKAKIDIRYESSLSKPIRNIELADPVTYMKLHNEAARTRNPLAQLPYPERKIDNTIAGTNPFVFPATNWYNELFANQVMNHRLNFNVSGGGHVARYYIAASFAQDNGVLKVDKLNNFNNNIDLKKYLLRSNININVTPGTEVVVRFHGTFDDYIGPIDGGSGLYNKVMRTNPVLFPAVFEPDIKNKYTTHPLFGNYGSGNYINPYADMVKGYKESNNTVVLAQLEIKQDLKKVTEGLTARMLVNTTRNSYFDLTRAYNPYFYQIDRYDQVTDTYTLQAINPLSGTEYLNYAVGGKTISNSIYGEAVLNYARTFHDKHDLSGMLVGTARESMSGNEETLQKSLPYRNLGISGRFTYAYDSRYFSEFNFGYNGSERFSKNHRFGFFPSMGLGWMISNESFWESLSQTVNKLKLRATYGLVGNDAIGDSNDRFFYLSQVNLSDNNRGASFGEEFGYSRPGVSVGRYANDRITWERSRKLNLGIELGLFNSIEILCDIFREDRDNILMNRSFIPPEMGLEADVRANVGKAYSQGIDLSVDYQKSFSNGLWLTGRGNFTYASGRYKLFEEPAYNATPWLRHAGQKLNQNWGYIAERLFTDQNDVENSPVQIGEYMAGDIKYRDINNDGQIDFRDKVPVGFPTSPEINYGLGISVGYHWIDVSCFFQGSARSSFWIDTRGTAPFVDTDDNGGVASNNALLKVYAGNHWSEQNQNIYALWPRLANRVIDNNNQTSTWFMQNGAFLRLKSLEAGCSLPPRIISRIGAEKLRIYFSATNLLTFSAFKLWDPEMGSNGLGYPVQQVFNAGVQISF